jgi:hypothetical protein
MLNAYWRPAAQAGRALYARTQFSISSHFELPLTNDPARFGFLR